MGMVWNSLEFENEQGAIQFLTKQSSYICNNWGGYLCVLTKTYMKTT